MSNYYIVLLLVTIIKTINNPVFLLHMHMAIVGILVLFNSFKGMYAVWKKEGTDKMFGLFCY